MRLTFTFYLFMFFICINSFSLYLNKHVLLSRSFALRVIKSTLSLSKADSKSIQQKSSVTKTSLITKNHDLLKAVTYLENCTEIGLDLEFDRNGYAYGFTLCLIQIYGQSQIYLIDPIDTKLDLSPLFRRIFENKDILKIIHAPSEDLRLLKSLNCTLVNLFDTERCAKLLDYQYTSLLYLLNRTLGIEINKSEQRSNWLKRPLSTSQLEYAAIDVLHLLDLKNKLLELGIQKGILQWIIDENNDWTDDKSISIDGDGSDTKSLIAKRDYRMFSPYQLKVLENILNVREKYAKLLGKPPFYILSKDMLYDIVMNSDQKSSQKLNLHLRKGGVHPKLKEINVSKEFEIAYQQAIIYANTNNLSKTIVKFNESLSFSDMHEINLIKSNIINSYGNFTANFILPMTLIQKINVMNSSDVFMNDTSIPLYRRQLIQKIIKELNINPFKKNLKPVI